MPTKIVINTCWGGFGLSPAAVALLDLADPVSEYDIPRHDPDLVHVVEHLGARANGDFAELEIVEIPGTRYRIREYDGLESVETPETIQWINAASGEAQS